ncbi:hypothetical protein T492DRAFT_846641 [Pavlovales sp. CCMP2436]|nr:hypothetical protein T492DRAFT_846641 [Pavlovales sp. CCMP2436]
MSTAEQLPRPRTAWDVDISLEKLVSWDVLEQFMQEFPDENALLATGAGGEGPEPAAARPQGSAPKGTGALGAGGLGAGGMGAGGIGAFSMPLDSPFMCPPWPPGAMPDFFGGSMPPFQMPPQIFGAMSGAPFFTQPPFFPPPPGGLGALGVLGYGMPGTHDAEGGAHSHGTEGSAAAGAGSRKGKATKRARSGTAKTSDGEGGGGRMRRVGSIDSGLGDDMDDEWGVYGGDKKAAHKQRFVWTAELHRRFEVAVNSLGIENAKPQAISQLMNIEGIHAPTRQNIKSHLQKYRLLLQKRSRSAAAAGGASGSGGTRGPGAEGSGSAAEALVSSIAATAAAAAAEADVMARTAQNVAAAAVASAMLMPVKAEGAGGGEGSAPVESQVAVESRLRQQELNLKNQLQLQAKLHRHMLMQRQLQHQLEVICLGQEPEKPPPPSKKKKRKRKAVNRKPETKTVHTDLRKQLESLPLGTTPRGQASLALRNDLRQQLIKAGSMQQEMLAHLNSLVRPDDSSADGVKPEPPGGLKGGGERGFGGLEADDDLFAEHVGASEGLHFGIGDLLRRTASGTAPTGPGGLGTAADSAAGQPS